MLLILDVQHTGRASRPGDMGAAYDLDSDGVAGEQGEREVDLVRGYVAAATTYARELGHRVTVLETGTYGQRHATAIRLAHGAPGVDHVYLACHVNAGGGAYGLLRPDYRSAAGAARAQALAVALSRLHELRHAGAMPGCRVVPLYPSADRAGAAGRDVSDAGKAGWWTRGWACLDGIYSGPSNLCGVLVEPGFIDSSAHRTLWTPDGLARIGRALVDGSV